MIAPFSPVDSCSLVPSDINKRYSWMQGTTINYIIFDNTSNKLISIKGVTFRELTLAALCQFCVHHQITAYKNNTKEMTGALIIQYTRTKLIADTLYTCSEGGDKDEDVVANDMPQNKKRKKKRLKSTASCAVSKPGTQYRIINTYMSEHSRPDVVNISSNPTIADWDSQCFLH